MVRAISIHVILIGLTIFEVFVYSTFIIRDHDQAFYEDHAATIAPYLAIDVGFLLLFFGSRLFSQDQINQKEWIGILFALTYVIIDVILLMASSIDWTEHYLVFIISFITKMIAGYLGTLTIM